jgi:hypothetical protein
MRTYRITLEDITGMWVATLLDDTLERPTLASQAGNTAKEALSKLFPYLPRLVKG